MNKMTRMTSGLLAATVAIGLTGMERVNADEVTDRIARLEQQVSDLSANSGWRGVADGVQIHGYGELHYNNLSGKGGAADKDKIDFHRFVLFFGYDFNDRIRFNSEFELEHSLAGDGKPGEVELE